MCFYILTYEKIETQSFLTIYFKFFKLDLCSINLGKNTAVKIKLRLPRYQPVFI